MPTQEELESMGDVNRDGIINLIDLEIIAEAYDSQPGDPNWCPRCDLNDDGLIDLTDIEIAGSNFGIYSSKYFLTLGLYVGIPTASGLLFSFFL